ncbi:uncharacterized protein [Ptychodera flava]|uniref:uncharacterized protein n=1 Tax=Ptychodera flava TaxID=63121 RepID=UPI003969C3B2
MPICIVVFFITDPINEHDSIHSRNCIKCTKDFNITTTIGRPIVPVSWPVPDVIDDSGTVHVHESHRPGSNFSFGATVVFYEISYPSGGLVSCSITVRVKAVIGTLFTIPNGTQSELSPTEIIESFNELSEAITGLDKVNLSQDESQALATDILKAIDEGIQVIQLAAPKHVNSNDGTDLMTESVLNTVDSLAKFVLRNTKPGIGPIVLDTPSVGLLLESNSIYNITNCTIVVGDGYGFTLPSADKLFANESSGDGTLNRIVIHLKRRGKGDVSVNDILSLSFTDREGNGVEEIVRINE